MRQFMLMYGAQLLQQRTMSRFVSEGDSASGSWAPLKRSTERWRFKQGYPPKHPINIRTTNMLTWATNQPVKVVSPSEGLTFVTYPAKQPTGNMLRAVNTAQKGRGTAPPRPIFAVDEVDMRRFITSLNDFVRRGV
jgi:hypothetical protein